MKRPSLGSVRLRLCMPSEWWGEPWLERVITLDQWLFWRGGGGKTNPASGEADRADMRWCNVHFQIGREQLS